jgi:outer membrane protein insertion porin family
VGCKALSIRALGLACVLQFTCSVAASAQAPFEDEAPIGRFGFGLFYGAEGGPGLEFDMHTHDLFGRGVEAEASFSTTQRARHGRIAANSPLASVPGWNIGVAISGSQTDRRGVSFEFKAIGAEVIIGRQISPDLRFSSRLRQVHSEISGVNTDQPVLIDDESAGWQIDRSIGYALHYRSPQQAYDGHSRLLAGFSQDFSGFGGDRKYLVSRASLVLRHGFIESWLRTRAELEVAGLHMQSGRSRISERFHLGDYMRGFRHHGAGPRDATATGNDAMGGNFLAVARFDAEVPLTVGPDRRLFGGAFVDVGSTWGLDDDRAAGGGVVDDQRRWRAVAGVNLGWNTGYGRLNLTLADAVVKRDGDKVMNVNVSFSTRF